LKPYGITALLEPFDREIDKKFLYGPVSECLELLNSLGPEADNIGIELDIAHLPLMGERIDHAIRACGKFLKRVHLGNCILKNKSNPLYGDCHPPIGIEDGEIDVDELALALEELLRIKYLDKDGRGSLVMEMIPYPGLSVESTIQYSMEKLNTAWKMANCFL
jgi:Sugar phosphate isomerases/epimerases